MIDKSVLTSQGSDETVPRIMSRFSRIRRYLYKEVTTCVFMSQKHLPVVCVRVLTCFQARRLVKRPARPARRHGDPYVSTGTCASK